MEIVGVEEHHRDEAVALWHAAGLTRPWNDPVADHDLSQVTVLGRRPG
jgi:hypothetical protein